MFAPCGCSAAERVTNTRDGVQSVGDSSAFDVFARAVIVLFNTLPERAIPRAYGVDMDLKRRIPLLRWSVWRMATGARNITKTGQIGDGREAAAVDYVVKHARAAPNAKVFSVELAEANAANARRIWSHAGVADRVTCVVGTIGDGGRTLDALASDHGFSSGAVDFLFLDHDKDAYLDDLRSILDRGWLRRGSIAVADNVRVPGAPQYRAYMREHQGATWNTVEHKTHLEYQSMVSDLVLESEYLG